jgi:hypothetical protein
MVNNLSHAGRKWPVEIFNLFQGLILGQKTETLVHENLRSFQIGKKCVRQPVLNGKVVPHFGTQGK